jgi:hypothetical protein
MFISDPDFFHPGFRLQRENVEGEKIKEFPPNLFYKHNQAAIYSHNCKISNFFNRYRKRFESIDKAFKNFKPKIMSQIRAGSGRNLLWIPVSEAEKAPDTGSATLHATL